jgi:hypothetical protein
VLQDAIVIFVVISAVQKTWKSARGSTAKYSFRPAKIEGALKGAIRVREENDGSLKSVRRFHEMNVRLFVYLLQVSNCPKFLKVVMYCKLCCVTGASPFERPIDLVAFSQNAAIEQTLPKSDCYEECHVSKGWTVRPCRTA